ncbi:MAG: AraC family transcriptional regulator [Saprospiraceae bacterium]
MAKQLLNFKGVYGEQEQPFWDSAVYIEPIRKRSAIYNFEINEHLHTNLVQIFILKKGGGQLFSEGKQIEMSTPCMIVIPNGVLHGFTWLPNVAGRVVTISLSFYENCLKENQNTLTQFQQLQYFSFENDKNLFDELVYLKDNLEEELKEKKVEKQFIINLLINLLMVKLYRKSIVEQPQVLSHDNRTLSYFNAFQKEISQTIDCTKNVKSYAKSLNITPVHLNRICQVLVQKSALQIIHEKLSIEAKKKLLYTNKTISEISYSLNFKEPSHFSKFFKKMVGISPRKFRQSQNGNFEE